MSTFRASYPDLTLATDVIVGFPGETEEAFQNTLKLLEEVKPDVVNVSKFFARPKTPVWNMKDGWWRERRSSAEAPLLRSWRSGFQRNATSVGLAGVEKCSSTRKVRLRVHGLDATLPTNQSS